MKSWNEIRKSLDTHMVDVSYYNVVVETSNEIWKKVSFPACFPVRGVYNAFLTIYLNSSVESFGQ